jgi:glutathione peroxidase
MRNIWFALTTGLLWAVSLLSAASVYDYELTSLNLEKLRLRDFQGKVLLIVNVASQCGYTPQYATLEALYRRYKDQGFVILGIPSNDFGQGEPGSDPDIRQFCRRKYDVTFPMSSKVTLGGNNPLPLYEYLTNKRLNRQTGGPIHWNFTKFLVSRQGTVLARFEPPVSPDDPQVVKAVEGALQSRQ